MLNISSLPFHRKAELVPMMSGLLVFFCRNSTQKYPRQQFHQENVRKSLCIAWRCLGEIIATVWGKVLSKDYSRTYNTISNVQFIDTLL